MNNGDTRVLARCVCTCVRRIGKLLFEISRKYIVYEWILYRTKLRRVHGIFETFDRGTVELWFTGDIDWYIMICNFQISLLCVEGAFRHRTDVLFSLSLTFIRLDSNVLLQRRKDWLCCFSECDFDFRLSESINFLYVCITLTVSLVIGHQNKINIRQRHLK